MKKEILVLLLLVSYLIAPAQVPVITSYSPVSGPAGTTVTITGNNFNSTPSNNKVFFGAVSAVVTTSTSSSIDVVVPLAATYSSIRVQDAVTGLVAYSNEPFVSTFGCSGGINVNSFAAATTIASFPSISYGLQANDLDNDGKIDLIVSKSNYVGVFKNTGSPAVPSFNAQVNFSITGISSTIHDIDGDSKPDLLSSAAGYIYVVKNTSTVGSISFNDANIIQLTTNTTGTISVKDLNGDGKPDIVVTDNIGKISVLRNTTSGGVISFATKVDYTAGSGSIRGSIADIDGDGKPDVVTVNASTNTISVLRNIGTGGSIAFSAKTDFVTVNAPGYITTADIDGDSKQDILCLSPSIDSISILKNTSTTGSISFSPHVDFLTGDYPQAFSIADIDGDSKPDIVVANQNSDNISIFKNASTIGSININSPFILSSPARSAHLCIGDFDKDEKPEMAVATVSTTAVLSLFRNITNGPTITSFTPTSVSPGGTVTVTGTNLTGTTSVTIGGKPVSSFSVLSPTSLSLIPDLGRTGAIEIITTCGIVNKGTLTVLAITPTISSFTPTSGIPGTSVTITGTNFNPTPSKNIIFFGTIQATVTGGNATSLTVNVPLGGTFDHISVLESVSELTAYSDKQFTTTTVCSGGIDLTAYPTKTTFISDANISVSGNDIKSADLDGDGKPDLIITTQNSVVTGAGKVAIFRNTSNIGSFSFDTKVEYPTGANQGKIAIGDLDGDGKLDIAVANSSNNTVSVFKNMSSPGSISFMSKIDFTTGGNPRDIVLSDINLDGKLDIITANSSSSTVSILTNIGNASINFMAKIDKTGLSNPHCVRAEDIDGDLKPDLIIGNSASGSNRFSVFRNTSVIGGAVSFATIINYVTIDANEDLCVGDIDGDGKMDVSVTMASSNNISVFRNLSTVGSIAFDNSIDLTTSINNPRKNIFLIDFDSDNKPELVAAVGVSEFLVFKNLSSVGSISFASVLNFPINLKQFILVDLDGDTNFDFASISSGNDYSIRRYALSLSPTISYFTPKNATPGSTVNITGSNFTGINAVSFAGFAASSFVVNSSTEITAVVGNVPLNTSGNISVTSSSCGTVNALEYTCFLIPDIISFSPSSGIVGTTVTINGFNFNPSFSNNIVYFGATRAMVTAGTGSSLTVTVPDGATYEKISVLDNATGLIGLSSTAFIVINNCGGSPINTSSFLPKVDISMVNIPISTSIADINEDGKPDLIALTSTNSVAVLNNSNTGGSISFSTSQNFATGAGPIDISIGDIDGDGKPDMAIVNKTDNSISVIRNTSSAGSVSFAPKVDFATGLNPTRVSIGDMDGDGKLDLAVTNYDANTISIYKNTSSVGTISFAAKFDITTLLYPESIILSDIDGDKKPEICFVHNPNNDRMYILRNSSTIGAISFAPYLSFTTGLQPDRFAVGDLNGDGKSDIAIANNTSNSISVLKNTSSIGTISFAAKSDFSTGIYPKAVSIGDLDGDGNPDLVATNFSSRTISILKNTASAGSVSFATKVDYTTVTAPSYLPAIGDLDGDGKMEIVIANPNANELSIFRNKISNTLAPTTTTSITYCKNDIASPLSATGSSLLWYTLPQDGIGSSVAPTPSTSVASITQFYVSQTINGCESPRTGISVTINNLPALPTVISPVNYCLNAVASSLSPTGLTLSWYTASSGGSGSATITPPTNATGSISYYVSEIANGCEGPRAQVDVITSSTPSPAQPTVTTPVTYCQNQAALQLSATGTALLWYSVSSGGVGSATTPIPSTSSTGTFKYYVSQTVNGCESDRGLIDIIVNSLPSAPIVSSPVNYTINAISTPLTASGSNLLWYSIAIGGVGSATAPTPPTNAIGNTTFYVSQTVNGCEGSRALINVVINPATAIVDNRNPEKKIMFYPNPSRDILIVETNNENIDLEYTLTDQVNKTLITGNLSSEKTVININQLSSGIYLIKIGKTNPQFYKIIKIE